MYPKNLNFRLVLRYKNIFCEYIFNICHYNTLKATKTSKTIDTLAT